MKRVNKNFTFSNRNLKLLKIIVIGRLIPIKTNAKKIANISEVRNLKSLQEAI